MPLPERANVPRVVERALVGSGIDMVGSCDVGAWDARAPAGRRSRDLFPSARGVVVVASGGPDLWRALRASPDGGGWNSEHPLDDFVARALDRADAALAAEGVGFRRFEPTLRAPLLLDFRALGEIVGLGSLGPFGMLIHAERGAWWGLRGAWLVDAEVDPPLLHIPPCLGCAAPCVASAPRDAAGIARATADVRSRCVVGQASRYDAEQIAYHYEGRRPR